MSTELTVAVKGPNMDNKYNLFVVDGLSTQAMSLTPLALVQLHEQLSEVVASLVKNETKEGA